MYNCVNTKNIPLCHLKNCDNKASQNIPKLVFLGMQMYHLATLVFKASKQESNYNS
jgi:hypothetical protein